MNIQNKNSFYWPIASQEENRLLLQSFDVIITLGCCLQNDVAFFKNDVFQ